MNRSLGTSLGLSLALVLVGAGTPPAFASPSTPRFVPISLAEIDNAEEYADDVANIIGAAYSVAVAPTEVDTPQDLVDEVPQDGSGAEVAEKLSEAIPLSAAAQASVAAITDGLIAANDVVEEDPVAASIDDGAETLSVTVAPAGIEVTEDLESGELVVEVSTTVASMDENDMETIELIETVLITDPETGAIQSIEQLDTEDYIAAAQHDSEAEPRTGPEATEGVVAPVAMNSAPFKSGLSNANKKKIADYALKYAINPNKSYRVMSADCTNFVSQAMTAGGWKPKTGWYRDSRHWWYNSVNQSWTWGGAENWYQFARKNSKRTTSTTASKLVPGDIVQVKFKGDKVINHTMVVTAKVGSTVYVSYHSRNTKNKKLATFMNQSKGATYYYHKS